MLFINKKKVVGNEYPEVPITLEQVMKDNPNTSIPRLSIANKLLKVEDVMESLGYEACYSEPIDVLKDLIGDSFKGKN